MVLEENHHRSITPLICGLTCRRRKGVIEMRPFPWAKARKKKGHLRRDDEYDRSHRSSGLKPGEKVTYEGMTNMTDHTVPLG